MVQRLKLGNMKNIALIAHDSRKHDLLEWVHYNRAVLKEHRLFGTGTTGGLVQSRTGLPVTQFHSGPLGVTSRSGPRSPRAISTC